MSHGLVGEWVGGVMSVCVARVCGAFNLHGPVSRISNRSVSRSASRVLGGGGGKASTARPVCLSVGRAPFVYAGCLAPSLPQIAMEPGISLPASPTNLTDPNNHDPDSTLHTPHISLTLTNNHPTRTGRRPRTRTTTCTSTTTSCWCSAWRPPRSRPSRRSRRRRCRYVSRYVYINVCIY